MTEATGRITNDPTDWKIHNWEQVLPGTGFDRIEAAARLVQLGAALTETLGRIARQEGLANQGDYQVLSILRLAHHQGQLVTATDVATKLQMTTATMVNRIDRLEKLGYTQRAPHPTDRRSTNLTITPVNRTGFPGDSISWKIMESWEDRSCIRRRFGSGLSGWCQSIGGSIALGGRRSVR